MLHSSFSTRGSGRQVPSFHSVCTALKRCHVVELTEVRETKERKKKERKDEVKWSAVCVWRAAPQSWKDTCGQKCTTVWRARRSPASSCSGRLADFHPTENRKKTRENASESQSNIFIHNKSNEFYLYETPSRATATTEQLGDIFFKCMQISYYTIKQQIQTNNRFKLFDISSFPHPQL